MSDAGVSDRVRGELEQEVARVYGEVLPRTAGFTGALVRARLDNAEAALTSGDGYEMLKALLSFKLFNP